MDSNLDPAKTDNIAGFPIKKIIHIAKMTNVAGMERHLLTLLPGLRNCGLDVSLIILVEADKPLDAYAQQMRDAGIPTEQMVMQWDFDPGIIWQLSERFRDSGCYAVHTHLIHADLHGVLAAKLAGVRHVFFTAHNDDSFRRYLPVRLVQGLLWRLVEAGITISDALRDFVIATEFAPESKVHTVHYGLDPSTISPSTNARAVLRRDLGLLPETPVAGSVCRLTTQKGIKYAIQAFKRLPNAHYVIAGDGPLREALEAESRELGLQDRIHFLGWRDDVHDLMAGFDVLVMPSLWEGFGLVALEAMAVRTPIIASQVSALPEIVIDGETGYLSPSADPLALEIRLNDLFRSPDRARSLGEHGRRRLEESFSVPQMVNGTLRVYGLI